MACAFLLRFLVKHFVEFCALSRFYHGLRQRRIHLFIGWSGATGHRVLAFHDAIWSFGVFSVVNDSALQRERKRGTDRSQNQRDLNPMGLSPIAAERGTVPTCMCLGLQSLGCSVHAIARFVQCM